MPAALPLAAQIIATVAVGSAGLAGTVMGGLIVAGAGVAVGLITRNNLGLDSDTQTRSQSIILSNLVTTQRTLPLIYGKRLVGSNDVFIEMAGSDLYDMWIVHCLGEGECDGIAQEDGKDLIYINDKLVSEYESGQVTYEFHSGTNTQTVDTGIQTATGGKFSDPMINTAYIVFKIKYDKNIFRGIPKRTIVLKGKKIFDFRSSTTVWSQNPVLILYDYLTNKRYGLNWDSSLLDSVGGTSSWVSAANYCDLDQPGVGKPVYYIDYVIATQIKAQTIIETILAHFRGAVSWFGGKLYLHYADLKYESSVAAITDSQIARNGSTKADSVLVSQPSRHNLPDGVSVKYVNARNNWTLDDFPIGDSNGQIQPIEFPGFTSRSLALEMGRYSLERQRLNRSYTIVLRPDTIVLDINDVITLTSTELGLTNQLCRVQQSNITSDGLIQASLLIEDLSLYDAYYQADTSAIYNVDLDSPLGPPPSVANATAVEKKYDYRGRSFIRLNVSFDAPPSYPWFSHVEVYVNHAATPSWKLLITASDDFQLDPVQENIKYDLRFVSVSNFGVKQLFDDAYTFSHTVVGINRTAPPSPVYLSATVSGTSLDLYSPHIENPDISSWEYRLGESWDEAIFIAAQKYSSITHTGVRPGAHSLWLDTWRDVSPPTGLYGATPVSADVVVEDPPPYQGSPVFYSQDINYDTTGTHVNTESVVVGSEWGLKCSHTNGVLTGTYTSPEYDTVNTDLDVVVLYLRFIFEVTGTSSTWNDFAPTPTEWIDLPATETWASILGVLGEASKLEVNLLYAETTGPPYVTVDRMELLTTSVKARFVKFEIKITDINLSTNLVVQPTTVVATKPILPEPPP